MQLETFRQELIDVIREHEDRYWTGYAIWAHFQRRFPQSADELTRQYTDGVGRGGDTNFGPVSYIAQSLGRVPNLVDRQWLHAKGLAVNGREASGDSVAVFRWRGDFDRTF